MDCIAANVFLNEANHNKVLTDLLHQKELAIVNMYASRVYEEKLSGLL